MNGLTIFGAVLLALGVAGMIWGGVEYYDNRTDIEVGDFSLTVEKEMPPVAIAGAVGAGVGLIVLVAGALGRRRNS